MWMNELVNRHQKDSNSVTPTVNQKHSYDLVRQQSRDSNSLKVPELEEKTRKTYSDRYTVTSII